MKSSSDQFYEDIAPDYDALMNGNAFYSNQNRLEQNLIERYVRESPVGAAALDIGCGTGEQTAILLGKRYHVVAVDSSEPMLNVARRKLCGADVEFLCLEGERVAELGRNRFDVVISMGSVLNHVDDWPALFSGVSDVLRSGGEFLFSIDNSIGVDSFVWPIQECVESRTFRPLARIARDVRSAVSTLPSTNEWPYKFRERRWQQHLRYYSWRWIQRTLRTYDLRPQRCLGANVLTPLVPAMMRSASDLGNPVSPQSRMARALGVTERLLQRVAWPLAANVGVVCVKE